MVEAGAGIAIVPNSCARRYASRKVLRFIPLEDEWAKRDLRLVRRPGRELPQFAETLIQYLTEAAREPV
jgi:DNA-binding transcriptional LysR family regulator